MATYLIRNKDWKIGEVTFLSYPRLEADINTPYGGRDVVAKMVYSAIFSGAVNVLQVGIDGKPGEIIGRIAGTFPGQKVLVYNQTLQTIGDVSSTGSWCIVKKNADNEASKSSLFGYVENFAWLSRDDEGVMSLASSLKRDITETKNDVQKWFSLLAGGAALVACCQKPPLLLETIK